ncbi:hypothetical protein LQZ19_05105 [Treponema primitia]|uniref:hypothetical protein n=1 Tax=Treponema primitia TaxID=88058 RepID=UPI00397FC30A
MTEQNLLHDFQQLADVYFKPKKEKEFEAYINGKGPWPKGITYKYSHFPEISEAGLGGPHDALALRILQAVALSMEEENIPYNDAGIRVQQSLGVSFEKIFKGVGNQHIGSWNIARRLFKYYPEESRAFLEANLSAKGKSKLSQNPLYGLIIVMAAEALAAESEKYKNFIPFIEEFVTKQFDEIEALQSIEDETPWQNARLACLITGSCSPGLEKLRRRLFYYMGYKWGVSGWVGSLMNNEDTFCTKEKLWETGKKISLPDEWFELLYLFGYAGKIKAKDIPYITPPDRQFLAKHFKALYAENRPLFDTVHRAFYSQFDGKTSKDEVPLIPKRLFAYSFYLLSIKLDNGDEDAIALVKELIENWDTLIKVNKGTLDPEDIAPFAVLYDLGIPQIEAYFTEKFAREASPDYDYKSNLIRLIIELRRDWATPSQTARAFIAGRHFNAEDFHNSFNTKGRLKDMEDWEAWEFPAEVVREYTAAHPNETRTYIETHLADLGSKPESRLRADDFGNWAKTVFSPGSGLGGMDALILFGAKSKRVFKVLEEILLDREDEVRAELEKRLPKFKKDASESAQRLFILWNAKKH